MNKRPMVDKMKDRKYVTAKVITILVMIASFGPYIFINLGLRLGHFVLYSVALIALIRFIYRKGLLVWSERLFILFVLWLGVIIWTGVISMLAGRAQSTGQVFAALENYLEPLAILLILVSYVQGLNREQIKELLKILMTLLIYCLAINSILATAQLFVNANVIFKYFAPVDLSRGSSVAQRAASMGRYLGIFDQPVEVGAANSLGLLAWVYMARERRNPNIKSYLALIALIVGGILSVSKLFILGGIPLFLIYWKPIRMSVLKRSVSNMLKRCSIVVILIAVLITLSLVWKGSGYFSRLFTNLGNKSLISLYTAGRFGTDESAVQLKFGKVTNDVLLYGFGFGSSPLLDNGFLEFYYQGGLVGLIYFIFILIFLLRTGFRGRHRTSNEGWFIVYFVILVVGGSLGAPIVTMNRFEIFGWLLVGICVYACSMKSPDRLNVK